MDFPVDLEMGMYTEIKLRTIKNVLETLNWLAAFFFLHSLWSPTLIRPNMDFEYIPCMCLNTQIDFIELVEMTLLFLLAVYSP